MGRRKLDIAPPGVNECPRCGLDMEHTSDMRRTVRGVWVHKWCMGGGDDE